ncbi:helix-turn-helix transcriptional regulator [Kribbella capetownensis]|uniref:helix-turn-helix transcriptional regulator n=1 Tax=Kribbella capetownensis TaxID=1572659 RepID=UPI0013F3CC43|nr:helix-turn-helix transcriptional regulator [Kribbella capetownensis]
MSTRTEPAFDDVADDYRRSELGDFLRIRRGKVHPEDVGMPSGGPRRTPGLRREEVAVLAAVGVTWYTWLEQGRPINPSEEVLASIARALQLSNDETDHVFILAGLRREVHGHTARRPHVSDMLRRLVEQQRPAAAFLMDARWDLVCWNDLAGALLGFGRAAPADRNVAWLMFADTGYGAVLDDRDRHARGLVAQLRLASGRLVGDDGFDQLLTRLRKEQPEFERLWNLGEVKCRMDTEKTFVHPEAGPIEVDEAVLRPSSAPDLQLTILVPRPGSDERLVSLL